MRRIRASVALAVGCLAVGSSELCIGPSCESDEVAMLQTRHVISASASHLSPKSDVPLLVRDHNSGCGTTILSTFFTSRHDPQRDSFVAPSFDYIQNFYRSVMWVPGGRVKAVVLHDGLPHNITGAYTTDDGSFSFVQVDLSRFEPRLGLNDLRFPLYLEQIRNHEEWQTVFMTDSGDVTVVHNPCALVEQHPEKFFVGRQIEDLKGEEWLGKEYHWMGGKYLEWYRSAPHGKYPLLNAGILGGRRDRVLDLLPRYIDVMMDPELGMRRLNATERKKRDMPAELFSNMPALNYVLLTQYGLDSVVTGYPLHSEFRALSNQTDVYFRHK